MRSGERIEAFSENYKAGVGEYEQGNQIQHPGRYSVLAALSRKGDHHSLSRTSTIAFAGLVSALRFLPEATRLAVIPQYLTCNCK